MIYVKRDVALIPQALLDKAKAAQDKLETLPTEQRAEFIKSKSAIWQEFKEYLAKMSYNKCWYSESPEVQSFFDVDHFRPKLKAKRSDSQSDPGYDWLAFSWMNFRLSAQRSNRLSTNEETDETEGKGGWFPLLPGSPSACWDDRCIADEKPTLLDPTVRRDVDLIDVEVDGRIVPSKFCLGEVAKARVARSAQIYGLNLPRLQEARKGIMRDVIRLHEELMEKITIGNGHPSAADSLNPHNLIETIREKTRASNVYARAARAQLSVLPGGTELLALPEDA